MKNLNKKILFIGILLVATLFLITLVSAAEANYCCEKTTSGAWCQNAPQAQCDSGFQPTSCDSTSYCKKGCCFDSNEGLCMEGTPQKVCEDAKGTWADNAQCDVPQCNLGCCILADQGAFVTLTRCKQMSGFYGLKTDFRTTIKDELTCVQTAQGADKGACVFEDATLLKKKCIFTTRANCKTANLASDALANESVQNFSAGSGFYKDYLCTAEELGTECSPDLKNTIVLSGKDEVYFKDTCGNIANIYDASKAKNKEYWKKVFKKSESCGYGSSNAGSTTCGNCDYFLGSIGKAATRTSGYPAYGSNICVDLSCKTYNKQHGESWCVKDEPSGDGKDTVGSKYYREICLNNELITEPCADFRNEICIEDSFNGFSEAQCRVNRWQDCTQQKQQSDCENYLARDCKWYEGYYFSETTGQIEKSAGESTEYWKKNPTPTGLCTPDYPPGFVFWQDAKTTVTPEFNAKTPAFGTGYVAPTTNTADANTQCGLGNTNVVIQWNKTVRPASIKGLEFLTGEREGDWECGNDACFRYVGAENAHFGEIDKASVKAIGSDMNEICTMLGDCGGKNNWAGKYTDSGYATYYYNQRISGSGGAEVLEKTATKSATTTGTTTGTTKSSGTNNVENTANLVNAGTGLVNTVAGGSGTAGVIADIPSEKPIQFKIIVDYFKNKLGMGEG